MNAITTLEWEEEIGIREEKEERKSCGEKILEVLPEAGIWTAELLAYAVARPEKSVRKALVKLRRAGIVEVQGNTVAGELAHNRKYVYRMVGTEESGIVKHDLGITENYVGFKKGLPEGYESQKAESRRFWIGKSYLDVDDCRVVMRRSDWQKVVMAMEHDTGTMWLTVKNGEPVQYRRKYELMQRWWKQSGETLRYLTWCPTEARLQFLLDVAEEVREKNCDIFWFTSRERWKDYNKLWEATWTVAGYEGKHKLL